MSIKIAGVTFKNPELQDIESHDYHQKVRRSYTGNIFSARLARQKILKLKFTNFPKNDAVTLKDLVNTTSSFTYQDYDGVTYTVKCLNESIDLVVDNAGQLGNGGTGDDCDEWVSFDLELEII